MLKLSGIRRNQVQTETYDADKYVPIPALFAGRSIFITGGTGFMGKVLIEKLLYSCPAVKTIYILMRSKRGRDVNERLLELLNEPLFERLRKQQPHQLSKIVPIPGDVFCDELGISASDQELLIRNVSIVFHAAATVRFDENLKFASALNMLGTRRVIQLCKRLKTLDALVHVSTAFSNCDRSDISEQPYKADCQPDELVAICEKIDEEMIDVLTPKFIGKKPNTYTFTKALAEEILFQEASNLPVAIVRPSIVIGSFKEPIPGWVDSANGATGVFAAGAVGLMCTMICKGECIAPFVPVDICINLMIAAAWRAASNKANKLSIYNCCTSDQNPARWYYLAELGANILSPTSPMEYSLWHPVNGIDSNRLVSVTKRLAFNVLPAFLIDLLLMIFGRKPMVVKIQRKIQMGSVVLEYFSTHNWIFRDNNTRGLLAVLSPEDRQKFEFDVKKLNWRDYGIDYNKGIRHYVLKFNPDSMQASKKRYKIQFYIHHFCKILAYLLLLRIFLRILL